MADFAVVAAAALARAEELLPRWLPNGKRRGHEWICGSLTGDAGDSCSTNLSTGKGADFATGQAGGSGQPLLADPRHVTARGPARARRGAGCAQRPRSHQTHPDGPGAARRACPCRCRAPSRASAPRGRRCGLSLSRRRWPAAVRGLSLRVRRREGVRAVHLAGRSLGGQGVSIPPGRCTGCRNSWPIPRPRCSWSKARRPSRPPQGL